MNYAGDVIDEAAGTVYRVVEASLYRFVASTQTIVVLQEFAIEADAELDLEGELAVIA